MRKLSLHHFCLLLLSVIGAVLISGCSTANTPYRTYYQDSRNCGSYYIDSFGNKVYEGSYGRGHYCGKGYFGHSGCRYQDASGRYYYQDSFGNKYYKPHACR